MFTNPYLAQITLFAGTFNPRSWQFCQGQLLAISQNTALFSLLGTTFGGNGQTTFALPDLRGRMAVHPGPGPGLTSISLGEAAGSESVTLINNHLPVHTHSFTSAAGAPSASTANGTTSNPSGAVPAAILNVNEYNGSGGGKMKLMNSTSITASAGGSQPLAIRQPYLAMNWIIAVEGIFPVRN